MVVVMVMMLVSRVGRDDAATSGSVWQKERLVGLKERPWVVGAEVDLAAAVDRGLAEGCKR